jgi:hypothetical protein
MGTIPWSRIPIAAGSLVRILPESRMDQLEVTALQARSAAPSIAVKALLKHLAQGWRETPWKQMLRAR